MLSIIIALVITVVLFIIAIQIGEPATPVIAHISAIIVIVGLAYGLFSYTEYNEWELTKETELVTLSNTTTVGRGLVYVSLTDKNTYTYRYEISSEFGTETSKNYVVETVSGNVIESEDINCKKPVLLEYTRKAKITIWSFGLLGRETKYVFYVPEGTIQKEVTLN